MRIKSVLLLGLMACSLQVMAGESGSFQRAFVAKYPSAQDAIFKPAFPGFWAVVKDNEILFVKEDLSLLIANAQVIDLKTNQSITEAIRRATRPKADASLFNLKDAIRLSKGKRKLLVFSDPDCPFCRRLEPTLAELKDVAVYIFPFPLTSLHPNAAQVSESIWCADQPAKAWASYMATGLAPTVKTCANPIERNLTLGQKLRIQGTPALIFEDGTIIPGAVGLEQIEAQLARSGSPS